MSILNDIRRKADTTIRLLATQNLYGATAATSANYGEFFIAPFPCQVEKVYCRFSAASSSGTLTINKAASGTAISSGTAILASTMSTAGTAATNVTGTLSTTAGATVLKEGDALGTVDGGTLTSLADLIVVVVLKPLALGTYQ